MICNYKTANEENMSIKREQFGSKIGFILPWPVLPSGSEFIYFSWQRQKNGGALFNCLCRLRCSHLFASYAGGTLPLRRHSQHNPIGAYKGWRQIVDPGNWVVGYLLLRPL